MPVLLPVDTNCRGCTMGLNYLLMSTPGPRLMRIHLVQYSTSARSGKVPQIFT